MAPLASSLFRLKAGYVLGTVRPKTMSLELLREQLEEERGEKEDAREKQLSVIGEDASQEDTTGEEKKKGIVIENVPNA